MITDKANDNEPFVVIRSHSGRLILIEILSAGAGILLVAAVLGALGKLNWEWLTATAVATVIACAIGWILTRRSRRIVIGDTWVEGPLGGASGRTTVKVEVMNKERSGFRNGRLRIMSISGRGIEAKTAWYSPGDIEEIKRLLRDRFEVVP